MRATCRISAEVSGGPEGYVRFSQDGSGSPVKIEVDLHGFELKNGLLGFHIHRFGDVINGCASMCEHFNGNRKTPHGGPDSPASKRHIGDLGNIRVRNHRCRATLTDPMISLYGVAGKLSIVGRGVVVHEKQDDLGRGGNPESLVTGNAGKRIACGVIGLSSDLY